MLGTLLLLMPHHAYAADSGPPSSDRIRSHVEFLAGDLLEGRDPGTRGFDLAARYVATQFRSIGLQPAVAGSWYQNVPLVERRPNHHGPARVGVGEWGDVADHAVAVISGEGPQRWSGDAVFVGYGLVSSKHGIDDYSGVDVRGKAVVLYDRLPATIDGDEGRQLAGRRAEIAFDRGAAGIITLFDKEAGEGARRADYRAAFSESFFNWLDEGGQPFRHLPMRFSAVMWPEAAAKLFVGAPSDFALVDQRAARGEPLRSFPLRPVVSVESSNQWRRYSSPNVIGLVPGSDPNLAREVVIVTSHLDHVGVDAAAPGEDKIFNGAFDNASGVAAMIEAARGLAAAPRRPRRSVLFAAVTAEESGLLGSDFLAANPVIDGARVVAVVNLDGGVPLHKLTRLRAIGGWHSTIGQIVEDVARSNDLGIQADDTPTSEFFERTDHFSFARRGIPSIYLFFGGDDGSNEKSAYSGHYHKPSDDLGLPFDWEAGARFAHATRQIVSAIADGDEAPRWYNDSPVAERYARGRARAPRPGISKPVGE